MRKLLAFAMMLCTVGVMGACSDSTGPGDMVGTYTLVSAGGEDLPVLLETTEGNVFLNSGTLTFNANGTFSGSVVTIDNVGGAVPETLPISGTYTRNGSALVLHYDATTQDTAVLSDETITIADSEFGLSLVFEKN